MRRSTRKPTTVTVYQNGKPVDGMEQIWGIEIAKRKAETLTGPYEIRTDRNGYLAAERKA